MRRHRSRDRRQVRKHSIYYRIKKFFGGFSLLIFVLSLGIPAMAEEAQNAPAIEEPAVEIAEPEYTGAENTVEPPISEPAEAAPQAEAEVQAIPAEDKPAANAGDKLAGGVGEVVVAPVEIPKGIAQTSEETNVIEGVTVGTIKGAGETVGKTAEGAVKAATFYIPDKEKQAE